MLSRKWLLIILFILIYAPGFSQTLLYKQLSFADSLFSSQQYFDAITEYKRIQFFDNEKVLAYKTSLKIGLSYKAGAKFEDAIKYFAQAEQYSRSIDEVFEARTQIIRTNILRKTTDRAIELCDQLEAESRFSDLKDIIYYWRGWAFMFAYNWNLASEEFNKINPLHQLKIICDKVEDSKVSVTFAKVISYILPGAGQFYSGNYLSGIMSLGWNLLTGYFTVKAFLDNRVFDGIVTAELLWLRFYRGNIQNAGAMAIEHNLEVANKALRYLQYEYKGSKP